MIHKLGFSITHLHHCPEKYVPSRLWGLEMPFDFVRAAEALAAHGAAVRLLPGMDPHVDLQGEPSA